MRTRTRVLLFCIVTIAACTLWVVRTVVGSGTAVGPAQRVVITAATTAGVASALDASGVLSPSAQFLFPFYVRFQGMEAGLHPGTFLIPAHAPLRQVVRILLQHGRAETRVTIPEGSSLRDVARILEKAGLAASADDVFAVTGVPATEKTNTVFSERDFSFLADRPSASSLEGYLFPDTYRFFVDASVRDVAQKMLETFDAKTKELREKPLPYPLRSFYDVVTLASVVEAEVRGADDQRRVADIFLRRLAKGMPLQADSTVHYATDGSGRFTSAAARQAESTWNTYQNPGLPRGPIASPGLAALQAVFQHTLNDALYFLTGPDGTVYYAKTLEEHVANKRHL